MYSAQGPAQAAPGAGTSAPLKIVGAALGALLVLALVGLFITKNNISKKYTDKARAMNKAGQDAAAMEYLNKALHLNRSNADAHYLKGLIHYRIGRKLFDRSFDLYRRGLNAYTFESPYKEALLHFHLASEYDKKLVDGYYKIGLIHADKARLRNYTRKLRGELVDDIGRPLTLTNLAREYARDKDCREALQAFTKALKRNPQHFQSLVERGHLYLTTGRIERALEDFNAAVKIRPDKELQDKILLVQTLLENVNKVRECNEEIRRQGDNPQLYIKRARVLRGMGDLYSALDDYNAALAHGGAKDVIFLERGRIFLRLGEDTLAAVEFSQLYDMNPDTPDAEFELGVGAFIQGKFSEALPHLDAAAEKAPDDPFVYYWRGLTNMHLNKEQAAADFNRHLELAPDSRLRKIVNEKQERLKQQGY